MQGAYLSSRVFQLSYDLFVPQLRENGTLPSTRYLNGVECYEFGPNDTLYFSGILPHCYALDGNACLRIHWSPGDRGVVESGSTVAWKLELSNTHCNEVMGSSTLYDLTDTCDGIDNKHQVSSVLASSFTSSKISTLVLGKLYRDTGDTWTINAVGFRPILCNFVFRIPVNTLGSRQRGNK